MSVHYKLFNFIKTQKDYFEKSRSMFYHYQSNKIFAKMAPIMQGIFR